MPTTYCKGSSSCITLALDAWERDQSWQETEGPVMTAAGPYLMKALPANIAALVTNFLILELQRVKPQPIHSSLTIALMSSILKRYRNYPVCKVEVKIDSNPYLCFFTQIPDISQMVLVGDWSLVSYIC